MSKRVPFVRKTAFEGLVFVRYSDTLNLKCSCPFLRTLWYGMARMTFFSRKELVSRNLLGKE